jgi:hypothetical protein
VKRSLAAAAAIAALAASGCGADPADPVAFDVAEPGAFKGSRFADVGLAVSLPADGGVVKRDPPGVFRASFGTSYIAGFAYRRREPLPKTTRDLNTARRRLLRAIRERSSTWKTISSRITRVDGARAIEVVGDQTVSRGRLRGRSLHIFRGKGEYVIEMEAPRAEFRTADRTIFRPALRSLKVNGKIQPNRKRYRVGGRQRRQRR